MTPQREWFTTSDASRKGRVCLGNDYACKIISVGDVLGGVTYKYVNIARKLNIRGF